MPCGSSLLTLLDFTFVFLKWSYLSPVYLSKEDKKMERILFITSCELLRNLNYINIRFKGFQHYLLHKNGYASNQLWTPSPGSEKRCESCNHLHSWKLNSLRTYYGYPLVVSRQNTSAWHVRGPRSRQQEVQTGWPCRAGEAMYFRTAEWEER